MRFPTSAVWGRLFVYMTYSEKLRDPRWQRKRLEIMNRDCFRCQRCHTDTTTLNVHHRAYLKNRDPWDYQDHMLTTLCETCHERTEANLKLVLDQIASNEVLMDWIELFSTKENGRAIECATGWIRSLMAFRANSNVDTLNDVETESLGFISAIKATSEDATGWILPKEVAQ